MFDNSKASALQKLACAIGKKETDKPALPLLRIINSKEDFFTSSSCYGRILLIDFIGIKGKSKFIGRWHHKVSFAEVKKALLKEKGNQIWLRMEPLILHISCRNLAAAKKILDIKNKLCIKRGGIFHIAKDRIQVEFEGTKRAEALVKLGDKILLPDFAFKKLVEIANKRFEENEKDWRELKKEFARLS